MNELIFGFAIVIGIPTGTALAVISKKVRELTFMAMLISTSMPHILDINLMGVYVDPVADLIERRGKPFLFATGYGPELLPSLLRRRPILRKPIAMDQLKTMIDSMFPKSSATIPS